MPIEVLGRETQAVSPRDLYRQASILANKGVTQGGPSSFYTEFIGLLKIDEGVQKVHISLRMSPGYDHIAIYGAGIQGSISNNMWDSRATTEERYRVSGNIPDTLSDVLSKLTPDKEAMAELDQRYREGYSMRPGNDRDMSRKLEDTRTPFWEKERILRKMRPSDAESYVRMHGSSLPFWIRKRFTKKR